MISSPLLSHSFSIWHLTLYFIETPFKDLYSCPIEIVNGLTDDREQLQYLTGLKGTQEGTYQISFTEININILLENTLPLRGPI